MSRLLTSLLAAASLAACATAPTVYQPANGPNGVGYAEQRIEPGRYRVVFQGGPGAPRQQVEDFALLRAADLAIAEGYDWFRVSERYIAGRPERGPRLGLGVGGADYGARSGVSVGLGTSFNLGGGPSLTATLQVFMGKGPRPSGLDVYDARAIRDNLGGRPI